MTAPAAVLEDDDTAETEPASEGTPHSDTPEDSAAAARKIAGYLIVAGVVIAAGCIAFIVWEQWQANRAVLRDLDGRVVGFPVGDVPGSHPAPHTSAPHSPSHTEGPASTEEL